MAANSNGGAENLEIIWRRWQLYAAYQHVSMAKHGNHHRAGSGMACWHSWQRSIKQAAWLSISAHQHNNAR